MEACRSAVGDRLGTMGIALSKPIQDLRTFVGSNDQQYVLPLGILMNQGSLHLGAWINCPLPRSRCISIIRGGFRMGVKKALVIKGLAAASGLEEAVLAHRLMGGISTPEAFQQLIHDQTKNTPSGLTPSLAPRGGSHQLGDRKDWAAEWKWDGIRMQLVRRRRRIVDPG